MKDNAFWAAIICGQVWAASSNEKAIINAVIWLAFALVMAVVELRLRHD